MLQFEAVKVALKQDRTGFVLTLSIHPDEIPEELIRDFVGARYAVGMVRLQDDESFTKYDNKVQQAGMLCKNEDFQVFLGAENETEAAHILCKKLGIKSRAELNGNAKAKAMFDELVKEYESASDPF